MKTPNLLEIPKDSPTRKERIKAFKIENGIETHDAGPPPSYGRWCAVLVEKAWNDFSFYCEDKSLFGLMAGAGRLIDESGLSGYGDTEITAIRNLCSENKIHCPI